MDNNPGVFHDKGKDGFQPHPGHAGRRRAGKQRRPFTEGKIHGHDRVILQRGLAYLSAEPPDQARQDVAYLARISGSQEVPGSFIGGQYRVGVDASKRVKHSAAWQNHARCCGRAPAFLAGCVTRRAAARLPWPTRLAQNLADSTRDRPALVNEPAHSLYPADIRLPVHALPARGSSRRQEPIAGLPGAQRRGGHTRPPCDLADTQPRGRGSIPVHVP